MTEAAHLHQNYTATCTIRSNPKTELYIFTQGCHFKCTTLLINEDTTEAIIIISNITQECRNITCATNLFQKSKRVGKKII